MEGRAEELANIEEIVDDAEGMNILIERKEGEFMQLFLQISVEFKLETIQKKYDCSNMLMAS